MKITRNGIDIELTEDEVYEAYKEHSHEMCKSDVRSYLEDEEVELNEKYVDGMADLMAIANERQVDMYELFDLFSDVLREEKIDIHDRDSLISYFGEVNLEDEISSASEKQGEQPSAEEVEREEER